MKLYWSSRIGGRVACEKHRGMHDDDLVTEEDNQWSIDHELGPVDCEVCGITFTPEEPKT